MKSKKVPIQYTARDFETIKQELVRHAKKYYPDSFQDFNEAGFGSLMLDTVAYVGDMLSFYLDYQVNESFIETANDQENIIRLARQFGYKHKNTSSSTGYASFYIFVPSLPDGTGPDPRYMPILRKNSTFSSVDNIQFILETDVIFDSENNEVAVGQLDPDTGIPTYFAIKAFGKVSSGEYRAVNIEIGEYKKFLKIEIPVSNIIEVVSVRDSNGYEYYEVENLSQDIVYKEVLNRNYQNDKVDNLLRPLYVPRRFVVEQTLRNTFLQFGSGLDETGEIKEFFTEPSNIVLKYTGKDYISDTKFDPKMLIESNKMGIVPSNTNLTINVRVNSGENVNIASNTLINVNDVKVEFNNEIELDRNVIGFIINSLEVNNEEPILGYESNLGSQDLKKMALSAFTTQNRAVTKEDYKSLLYRMPKKFGSIKRANAIRDEHSFKRNLNIYVISENNVGHLQKSSVGLKQNAKIWITENKMINDVVDILDAKIVNLSIYFDIINDNRYSKEKTLTECLSKLKEFYRRKPEIGEPFFISDIQRILRDVDGVLDVVNISVQNKSGGVYSPTFFDVDKQRSPDETYLEIPKNAIWEIKYLDNDIKGVVL